jgi:TonB family protein
MISSPAFAAQDNRTGWQRIVTEDKEFSILIGGEPKIYHRPDVLFGNGARLSNGHVYGSCTRGLAFLIEIYDSSNPGKGLNALLDGRRDAQSFEHDISLNGFSGKQYRGNWKGVYSNIQYFTSKKRIYVVQLVARDEKNPAIQLFLSSLKLGSMNKDPGSQNLIDLEGLPTGGESHQVFKDSELTASAIVLWIPKPGNSPQAIQKHVKGVVTLRCVLSGTGEVTDITVLKSLGHGLDEKAIEAAKAILFMPAEKDGHPVSQYAQFEYNFNAGL